MKRLMILAGLLGALVFASPAQAHRWSYDNARIDAFYSNDKACGGGWYGCDWTDNYPYLVACTEHSWCWGYNHVTQYIEQHLVSGYRHNCHQHAKQYHGAVYVEATDICGPMYAKRAAAGFLPSLMSRLL